MCGVAQDPFEDVVGIDVAVKIARQAVNPALAAEKVMGIGITAGVEAEIESAHGKVPVPVMDRIAVAVDGRPDEGIAVA